MITEKSDSSVKILERKDWPCPQLKDHFFLGNEIGHGAYGSVFEATHTDEGKKYAMKKMEKF